MNKMTATALPFEIPVAKWVDFTKGFAKLNRRAVKLGTTPCTYAVVGEAVREHTYTVDLGSLDGERAYKRVKVPVRLVTVDGPAPKLAGWQLVAKVESLATAKADGTVETATLVHTLPGVGTVDERFRATDATSCEHCRKARRRTDTYVVRSDATGEEKLVGRNCLGDFTGGASPEKVAAQAAWLARVIKAFGEEGFGGAGWSVWKEHAPVRAILEFTAAWIRAEGWTPINGGKSGHVPTGYRVGAHFGSWAGKAVAELRKAQALAHVEEGITAGDTAQAAATVAWVAGELAAKRYPSDYDLNLVLLVTKDIAQLRHVGLVASALATALRAKSREAERAAEAVKLAASEWVGAVGERLRNLPATVLATRPLASDYGAVTMVKLLTPAGAVLTWFGSGDHTDLAPGKAVVVTGTVKRHGEYKGVKETHLSRCVIGGAPVAVHK